MRGLSLTQPWASLVAIGAKRIETRGWTHTYRGVVAIHAAQKMTETSIELLGRPEFAEVLAEAFTKRDGLPRTQVRASELPKGAIIAVAEIDTIFRFTEGTCDKIIERSHEGGLPKYEALFGDYAAGRYGIVLQNVRELATPVPCRGQLSLWEVPGDAERLVVDQLWKEATAPIEGATR